MPDELCPDCGEPLEHDEMFEITYCPECGWSSDDEDGYQHD